MNKNSWTPEAKILLWIWGPILGLALLPISGRSESRAGIRLDDRLDTYASRRAVVFAVHPPGMGACGVCRCLHHTHHRPVEGTFRFRRRA
jgi:hypothetical protein